MATIISTSNVFNCPWPYTYQATTTNQSIQQCQGQGGQGEGGQGQNIVAEK